MELKIGDVVRLKSGGPQMTISEYPIKLLQGKENCKEAKCDWFDGENHLHHGTFSIEILENCKK